MYIFDGAEYLKMEEAKQAKLKSKLKVKQVTNYLCVNSFSIEIGSSFGAKV